MSLFAQYLQRREGISKVESMAKTPLEFISDSSPNEFKFDVDKCIEKAKKGEKLSEATINLLCVKVKEIFMAEENVCELRSPITLVGDVHG